MFLNDPGRGGFLRLQYCRRKKKSTPWRFFGHNQGVISAVWCDLLPHESSIPPRGSGVFWGGFGRENGGFLKVFRPSWGGDFFSSAYRKTFLKHSEDHLKTLQKPSGTMPKTSKSLLPLQWGGMEVRYYTAIPLGSFGEVSGPFWAGVG